MASIVEQPRDLKKCRADLVALLPIELDENMTQTVANKNTHMFIMKNLLSAGLAISYFYNLTEDLIILRISADNRRLHIEAERIEFQMREHKNYSIEPEMRPPVECFHAYRKGRDEWYTNAFASSEDASEEYIFCSLERARLCQSICFTDLDENGADLQSFVRDGTISEICVMQDPEELDYLAYKWFDQRCCGILGGSRVPGDIIRDYFGEQVALYAEFSAFYTKYLLFPAVLGTIVAIVQFVDSLESPVTPAFGILICLWGSFFVQAWQRHEAELACAWNVEMFEASQTYRPEYSGHSAMNQITGEMETIYPSWKRFLALGFSYTVLFVLIVCVIASTLGIILLREFLFSQTYSGALLCGIITYAQIAILNKFYYHVAVALTGLENHRYQVEHEDSIIAKSFIFKFFNSYSSFFYMAFVADNTDTFGVENQCLDNDCMKAVAFQVYIFSSFDTFFNPSLPLHELMLVQLGTIFVMHITVQQILEVILPYVNRERWSLWLACKIRCSHCCKPKSSEEVNILRANMEALTDEEAMLLKPHYIDTIEDFSELVLQYGFVSLFASAFPLGFLIAYLNNLVEVRSDGFKICMLHRRPPYGCAQDIGTWFYLLQMMSLMSVVTNTALIVFTSSSLDFITEGMSNEDAYTVKVTLAFGVEVRI